MIEELVGEKLELEFNTQADSAHYEITPYNYNPKLGRKFNPELYTHLGQGLLQIIECIHMGFDDKDQP